jgi:hypothetical protein
MSSSVSTSNGRRVVSVESGHGLCVRLLQIGVYCGRRVTKLYGAGRLFACRHCYRLVYASQQEAAHQRGLLKSQKIRIRLGGSPSMLDEFPDKPKGMHWRTYDRLCRVHDAAEEQSTIGLMDFVQRLGRRTSRRA